MKPILIINHHDSFIYNLVQLIEESVYSPSYTMVYAEDSAELDFSQYAGILLSPGPYLPKAYPQVRNLLSRCYQSLPILGVCLGHQMLATFFGAKLQQMIQPAHGQKISLEGIPTVSRLFGSSVQSAWEVGCYHSWVIEKESMPDFLKIIAISKTNEIMAFEHKYYPLFGVQFHPESYLSNCGQLLLHNWLSCCQNKNFVKSID